MLMAALRAAYVYLISLAKVAQQSNPSLKNASKLVNAREKPARNGIGTVKLAACGRRVRSRSLTG